MPILDFKKSDIFPEVEYGFAKPDEQKIFDKYKKIGIKKLSSFDVVKKIEEVEPYPDELALIKKYRKMTTEEKGLISWDEVKKKYA